MVNVSCPHCETEYRVRPEAAAGSFTCAKCRRVFSAPLLATEPDGDVPYDFPRRRRRSAFGGWAFGLLAGAGALAVGVGLLAILVAARARTAPRTVEAAAPAAGEKYGTVGEMLIVGDVGVSLHGVAVERVALRAIGERGESARPHIAFAIKVHSKSGTRKVEYDPWIGLFSAHCRLTDDRGNNYRPIDFGIFTDIEGRQEVPVAVYPGEPVPDRLVFERPMPSAEWLLLELPGDRVGVGDTFKFRVPASAWK